MFYPAFDLHQNDAKEKNTLPIEHRAVIKKQEMKPITATLAEHAVRIWYTEFDAETETKQGILLLTRPSRADDCERR
jgi:hypothetical protein